VNKSSPVHHTIQYDVHEAGKTWILLFQQGGVYLILYNKEVGKISGVKEDMIKVEYMCWRIDILHKDSTEYSVLRFRAGKGLSSPTSSILR